jgi:hypothetical protein
MVAREKAKSCTGTVATVVISEWIDCNTKLNWFLNWFCFRIYVDLYEQKFLPYT